MKIIFEIITIFLLNCVLEFTSLTKIFLRFAIVLFKISTLTSLYEEIVQTNNIRSTKTTFSQFKQLNKNFRLNFIE